MSWKDKIQLKAANKAVKAEPNNIQAWIQKSKAEMSLNLYFEGLKSVDKVLELDPHNPEALRMKNGIATQVEAVIEEIAKIDKILTKNPLDTTALVNKGLAHLRLHELETALKVFNKIIEINPSIGEALARKGSILSQMGKHYDAMIYITKALKIEPENDSFWVIKATAFGAQNDKRKIQQAIECCDKALEINPTLQTALKFKSICIEQLKSWKDKIQRVDDKKRRISIINIVVLILSISFAAIAIILTIFGELTFLDVMFLSISVLVAFFILMSKPKIVFQILLISLIAIAIILTFVGYSRSIDVFTMTITVMILFFVEMAYKKRRELE